MAKHSTIRVTSMACEARILRVLRTLEYPGLDEAPDSRPTTALGLEARPHDLAKIVAWIEDRKVRVQRCEACGQADQLLLAESQEHCDRISACRLSAMVY